MKKKIVGILMIGFLSAAIFRFGMVAGASSKSPGSSGDPLITQSYLEQRLSEVTGQTNSGQTATSQPVVSNFKKVSVTKDKKLELSEGSEFIIYSGEATIYGNKGMLNLSSGSLQKAKSKATSYQHYLSPAGESGVKATANCVIYVKGSYVIN